MMMQQPKVDTQMLVETLKNAINILVTAHVNLDHDAICSLLLIRCILKEYLHNTKYRLITREPSFPGAFIRGFPGAAEIENIPLDTPLDLKPFDLIILVDTQSPGHSMGSGEFKKEYASKTIMFDHHPISPDITPLIRINERLSSASEQVYVTFREIFPEIRTNKSVALLAQAGIMSDTERFLHSSILTPQTFSIMAELFETNPIHIEQLFYRMIAISKNAITLVHHILSHISYESDFVYSWIDSDFIEKNDMTSTDVSMASNFFKATIIRGIENINWGFLVKRHSIEGYWYVSFRGIESKKEVLPFAKELGGGGHLFAAAAEFQASSVEEAVKKVLEVIQTVES